MGTRLGRPHAIWALYTYSLRVVYGIGRSFWAKAAAFGILAIAFLPAIVQLGIVALSNDTVDVVKPEDYYGVIEPLIAIFCAIVAPEIIGRDQRTRTLSLYFSRALRREDYAIAKYASFITAMLSMTLAPQLLMFVGNASSAHDVPDYMSENWDQIPAIVGSAFVLSALVAGIGLAIGAQTSRRAYSTVAIVAVFLLGTGVASAVFGATGADSGKYALLFSPFHVVRATTFWFFGVTATTENQPELHDAGIHAIFFVLDALVVSAACFLVVVRRYRRIAV